jgi:biotin operon repressor
MKQTMTVQVVLAALRVHPGRAMSRAELATLADCSERQIRTAISDLRRQGWLVVGDASGYRIAQTVEEVIHTVMSLERQIHSLDEVITAMRTAALSRFGISGYPPCRADVQLNAPMTEDVQSNVPTEYR